MRIYVGHSSAIDYKSELYQPIRASKLNEEHEFILPHETTSEPTCSKEVVAKCDLLIAEISERSTGLGIELGWADALGVPIVAIYRRGAKFSKSIGTVCRKLIEYSDKESLIQAIEESIDTNK